MSWIQTLFSASSFVNLVFMLYSSHRKLFYFLLHLSHCHNQHHQDTTCIPAKYSTHFLELRCYLPKKAWSVIEGLLIRFTVLCPYPISAPSSVYWTYVLVWIEGLHRAVLHLYPHDGWVQSHSAPQGLLIPVPPASGHFTPFPVQW